MPSPRIHKPIGQRPVQATLPYLPLQGTTQKLHFSVPFGLKSPLSLHVRGFQ